MKKALAMAMAAGLMASVAMATDVNMNVQSADGDAAITVAPGDTVNYRVTALLSDNTNEGLALIGFDLVYDGGDLAHADTPTGDVNCSNPMPAFVKPDGITNPEGYGGTIINGDLIQVGGGQNTIKNTADNADFPIGTVITGVAQPSGCGMAIVATGSLTIPGDANNGDVFHLMIQNPFANVIKAGETGEPFWASEAAGIGTTSMLTMTVGACQIASVFPPNCAIDARYPTLEADANTVFGWSSVDVTFECTVASLPDLDFTVTRSPAGPVPTIMNVSDDGASTVTLTLDGPIPPGAWTCFTHSTGAQTCLGFLPGDVDASHATTASDILAVIDNLNGALPTPLETWQCDVDRSGECNAQDILGVIDLLNGAGQFDSWNNVSLPACPSAP